MTKGREHWLGLRNIYLESQRSTQVLRVRLVDLQGRVGYAFYQGFVLEDNVRHMGNVSKRMSVEDVITMQDTYTLGPGTYLDGYYGEKNFNLNGR